MDKLAFYRDFKAYAQKNADAQIVKKYSRYFKEGYDAWGLTQELMDAKTKEIMQRPDFKLPEIAASAPLFFKSGKYEETAIILSILNRSLKNLDLPILIEIDHFFAIGIHNWAHADILAMNILPEFLLRGLIKIEYFKDWRTSAYKFKRRCVPVTFIKFIKRGHPVEECIKFVEPLMTDADREVHQGVGWFLREAWKLKPAETETFLMKWKNTAPRLIFQYACEKMKPEDKQRFRKEK